MEPFVENLVVDAAGFIKYAKLENIGKKIYTITEIVDEIRDKTTKERLKILPYELNFKNPTIDSLKFVTEFSKKTGDYASLSATDLKVIALTYELEKSIVGADHLKIAPVVVKKEQNSGSKSENKEEPQDKSSVHNLPPGFYQPAKNKTSDQSSNESQVAETLEKLTLNPNPDHDIENLTEATVDQSSQIQNFEQNDISEHENSENEEEFEDEEDEDDNEEGWITPENLSQVNKTSQNRDPITVGCITGDFAIQNVLMHIGLHVVSVDGSMIKRLQTYILRCFSCYKTTSIMTKKFCPECGNSTLKRVAVTVNEDGSKNIHISKRRTINTKGFNKPIPLFRGGKHADNPILCPDQPMPQNRLSNKALQKLNVLDSEYAARDSPFLDKDIYSRSALLGVRKLQSNKSKRRK